MNSDPAQLPPELTLQRLIVGDWVAQAVQVAAKLGLADQIHDGRRTAEELAQAVGAHTDSLRRLLRALVSVGVFFESEDRTFSLTPVGQFLRTGVPGSLRALATIHTDIEWSSWGNLFHSVKTGETAFRHVHGMGYFDYLDKHPALGRLFDEGMTEYFTMRGIAIATSYDFSPFTTIVDVGGGRGAVMQKVLEANPRARGVIFDLPKVVSQAMPLERCTAVGGDFFESIPTGGDVYLMASILHDWNDEQCLTILRNCRHSMANGAKLLLIEMVLPDDSAPAFATLLDLEMLVCFGGRERTGTEYRNLLNVSGFRMTGVIPTGSASSLIEAEPV